ncbi:MAG: uroporphyrinogen decarboxylase family protein [candidate division WOR-3 bacterium]
MRNRIEEVIQRKRKFSVFPIVCADHCAHLLNKNFKRVATNGKVLAETLEYGYNLYGYDMVLVFSDPYVEAEAMGCELKYAPYPMIASCLDFNKSAGQGCSPPSIINQVNSMAYNRIEEIITAAKILKEDVDVPVFVSIKGPFSLACFLYGIEEFLKVLLDNEKTAKSVIKMALDFQIGYLERLLQIPVHIFIGDPLASASIISPLLFKKFAFDPLKILIRKAKNAGIFAGIHICGDTNPIIEFLDDLKADVLSIEDTTLKTRTLKMGGVSTITLLSGNREKIKKEIEFALREEFLILSTSCDVPVNTPSENIKTMIEIARKYEN